MTTLSIPEAQPKGNASTIQSSVFIALADAYRGFVAFTRNGMAVLGASLAALVITLAVQSDLRMDVEQQLLSWLQERQDSAVAADDAAMPEEGNDDRLAVAQPPLLPKQQAAVTQWLSRKYRVAPEPLGALVAEAFAVGAKVRLDPTLILAVMAIESRFNPYAQSPVGAQGLMQVLTRVHTDKYDDYGGAMAAFDPLSNLRVGVKVLQDCIKQAGSVEGGLRLYVGAVTTDGSGYINKVMAEHLRIQSVALGKPMPTSFPIFTAAPAPSAPEPIEPTQTGLLDSPPEAAPASQPVEPPADAALTNS
ncbi:transglycosylase SLT domain-containing protein [Hydrogenophaga flava]|uniref:transglycosylase SLT domain-containing protein n=1 Tax=Hydrogenophaga flava TaxID=65657 RepID=UPI0009FEA37F|nr:transglycosylase SLT domain-containing protein [Hydrogenophaga flava]